MEKAHREEQHLQENVETYGTIVDMNVNINFINQVFDYFKSKNVSINLTNIKQQLYQLTVCSFIAIALFQVFSQSPEAALGQSCRPEAGQSSGRGAFARYLLTKTNKYDVQNVTISSFLFFCWVKLNV